MKEENSNKTQNKKICKNGKLQNIVQKGDKNKKNENKEKLPYRKKQKVKQNKIYITNRSIKKKK